MNIDDDAISHLSIFIVIIDDNHYRRFRILNSVYRGHVATNADHLTQALKIIMHSNYLHTRDHPQRNHMPMNLDLDEVDAADAGPRDPDLGSGFTIDDFQSGDKVLVWQSRTWWHAKVRYKLRNGTISVRLVGANANLPPVLPKFMKPAP